LKEGDSMAFLEVKGIEKSFGTVKF